jgi:hypothetical protein
VLFVSPGLPVGGIDLGCCLPEGRDPGGLLLLENGIEAALYPHSDFGGALSRQGERHLAALPRPKSRRLPFFCTRQTQLLLPVVPTMRKRPSPSPSRPGRLTAFTPVADSFPIAYFSHILSHGAKLVTGGKHWTSPDADQC